MPRVLLQAIGVVACLLQTNAAPLPPLEVEVKFKYVDHKLVSDVSWRDPNPAPKEGEEQTILEAQVWRAQDLSGYSLRGVVHPPEYLFRDVKVVSNSEYRYKVRVIGTTGVSKYSDIVTVHSTDDAPEKPVVPTPAPTPPPKPTKAPDPEDIPPPDLPQAPERKKKISNYERHKQKQKEREEREGPTEPPLPPGYRAVAAEQRDKAEGRDTAPKFESPRQLKRKEKILEVTRQPQDDRETQTVSDDYSTGTTSEPRQAEQQIEEGASPLVIIGAVVLFVGGGAVLFVKKRNDAYEHRSRKML
jgi:LPXTG-motif cell wall-anchored protein